MSKYEFYEERADAIDRLEAITCRLEKLLDQQLSLKGYDGYETDLAQLVQAYVPAEMALLQLMKEESEDEQNE